MQFSTKHMLSLAILFFVNVSAAPITSPSNTVSVPAMSFKLTSEGRLPVVGAEATLKLYYWSYDPNPITAEVMAKENSISLPAAFTELRDQYAVYTVPAQTVTLKDCRGCAGRMFGMEATFYKKTDTEYVNTKTGYYAGIDQRDIEERLREYARFPGFIERVLEAGSSITVTVDKIEYEEGEEEEGPEYECKTASGEKVVVRLNDDSQSLKKWKRYTLWGYDRSLAEGKKAFEAFEFIKL